VRDLLMLAGAGLACFTGLVWLALAMDVHWTQVRADAPLPRRAALPLRGLASLVWVMSLAAAALLLAFTLSWRPRALTPWVAWLG